MSHSSEVVCLLPARREFVGFARSLPSVKTVGRLAAQGPSLPSLGKIFGWTANAFKWPVRALSLVIASGRFLTRFWGPGRTAVE